MHWNRIWWCNSGVQYVFRLLFTFVCIWKLWASSHVASQGRWPEKSVKMLIGLLKNAEANAESKNLDTEKLVITHIACNRSPPGRRRTSADEVLAWLPEKS